MPTPFERLATIVDLYVPAKVKFKLPKGLNHKNVIILDSVVIKNSEMTSPLEDVQLFELLKNKLSESWNPDIMKYEKTTTIDSLWHSVVTTVATQYDRNSVRCDATRRKTTDFIKKIKIDDKMLSGFLLQTFIKVQASDYKDLSMKDREVFFEQFDSFRRTFGKRV